MEQRAHHGIILCYLKHDALCDYPCCNHRISHFHSILVATSSSNPHLSTQTVDNNNLIVASPLQLTSFFRSSLTNNIEDKLKLLLTTILPNTFSHADDENGGGHIYGEHHHTEAGCSLIDMFLTKIPIAPCYCQMMGRTLKEEIKITQYNNPTNAGKYSLEDLFRASDNIPHHYPKF